MPLQDELCFVQFIHPGGEHQPHGNAPMGWNQGPHKRKFVEIRGRCRRRADEFDGPIRFWTEWEPPSDVTPIEEPLDSGPRFIHRPFYVIPDSYRGLQNTDPFVFGGFFYTVCRQNTRRGPTQLRYLKKGSVILFGSRVGGQFAIDTVFVVGDKCKDHNAGNFQRLKNAVSRAYWEVTLRALYHNGGSSGCREESPGDSYRLYWGATFRSPVDDMFSFFPVVPADHSPKGTCRPVIEIPEVVRDNLCSYRLNPGLSQAEVIEYWNFVREQVESKGLWLGVHADIPQRRGKPQ